MFLGINYNGMHDSSVCLVDGSGRTLYAVSEERLSRVKQDGRFPRNALSRINLSDVGAIGIPYLEHPAPRVLSDEVFRAILHPLSGYGVSGFPDVWRDRLGALGRPLYFFDHHQMHAYTAFMLAEAPEALVLTSDNGAYTCPVTSAVFHARPGKVERIAAAGYGDLDALAALYSDVTALLGFAPGKHEGKVTGLAAYGRPSPECRKAVWELHREIRAAPGRLYGWIGFLDEQAAPFYEPNLYLVANYREMLAYSDADIARAAQDLLEEKLTAVAQWVSQTFGGDLPLLLSGGVFANVKANLELARLGRFPSVFVCPPMGDEGLSLGAAQAAFELVADKRPARPALHPPGRGSITIGPVPCDDAAAFLDGIGLAYRRPPQHQLRAQIAEVLADGGLVALARGPQEFGPRALGQRSILAGAADASINKRLNDRLRRTEFMPFAPLLRDERFDEIFSLDGLTTEVRGCLPFMTICLPVQQWVSQVCPAVVHADGTARPQVLRQEDDPFLYALLEDYENCSGLPLVVNTSFNMHDEPIVSSASDAVAAFLAAELDVLVLEDCAVLLAENSSALALADILRRDQSVARARRVALNLSFGRQIFEGSGRFNQYAPPPSGRVGKTGADAAASRDQSSAVACPHCPH